MLRKIPMRKCLGCLESKPKKELIRIVKLQDGTIVLDKTGKQNGRGAYVCLNAECLEKAIISKRIEKEFEVSISKEIYDSFRNNI